MNETRKWILHRVSAIILAPLYTWLFFSLISLSNKNYSDAIYFFSDPSFKILTIALFFVETQLGFSGQLINWPIVKGTLPEHENRRILILIKKVI